MNDDVATLGFGDDLDDVDSGAFLVDIVTIGLLLSKIFENVTQVKIGQATYLSALH